MAKTNYHNHTYLCGHAEGLPIDYIRIALEKGYQEIGISDHGPLFDIWQTRMTMEQFYEIYLPNLELAQKQYGDKIKIYKGLEMEYFPEFFDHYQKLLNDLDYLILGQHFIQKGNGLLDLYHLVLDEDLDRYRNAVVAALDTGLFRILAHPDIYLFSHQTWNEHTAQVAHDIIQTAIKNNVFLEINVNGIRRRRIINQDQEVVYIYPRKEFWQLLQNYPQAKILINEDNHALKQIDDAACAEARAFARNLGLKITERLFGEHHD
jgi:histidinol-phosphatase (PHP family)